MGVPLLGTSIVQDYMDSLYLLVCGGRMCCWLVQISLFELYHQRHQQNTSLYMHEKQYWRDWVLLQIEAYLLSSESWLGRQFPVLRGFWDELHVTFRVLLWNRYEFVYALIRDFPNLKFTLNGGVVRTHQVSLFSFCCKNSTPCSAVEVPPLHISVDTVVFGS